MRRRSASRRAASCWARRASLRTLAQRRRARKLGLSSDGGVGLVGPLAVAQVVLDLPHGGEEQGGELGDVELGAAVGQGLGEATVGRGRPRRGAAGCARRAP